MSDELHQLHNDLARCEAENATLRADLAAAQSRLSEAMHWKQEGDEPIPEDDSIAAAHPVCADSGEQYEQAMRLVGAKRSKAGLVALVTWLLYERHRAERNQNSALSQLAAIEAQLPNGSGVNTAERALSELQSLRRQVQEKTP